MFVVTVVGSVVVVFVVTVVGSVVVVFVVTVVGSVVVVFVVTVVGSVVAALPGIAVGANTYFFVSSFSMYESNPSICVGAEEDPVSLYDIVNSGSKGNVTQTILIFCSLKLKEPLFKLPAEAVKPAGIFSLSFANPEMAPFLIVKSTV